MGGVRHYEASTNKWIANWFYLIILSRHFELSLKKKKKPNLLLKCKVTGFWWQCVQRDQESIMMLNDLKPHRHNSDDTVMPLSQTIRHRLKWFYLLSLQQNKHCKQQSSSKLSKLKMIVVEKMTFDQSSMQASICSRLGRILTGCSHISFFFTCQYGQRERSRPYTCL